MPQVQQGPAVTLPKAPSHNSVSDNIREVAPEDMIMREGELGTVRRSILTSEDSERLNWYLRAILTANVYDVAIESPLDYAPRLSERIGAKIHFKREDLQPVFSFKLRGAYNRMAAISKESLSTASSAPPRVTTRRASPSPRARARMRRCHRHARHHSRHQGGRGAQTRRHGGAGRGRITTRARRTPSNAPKTRAEPSFPPSTIRWWWLVRERWAWRWCVSCRA